MRDAQLIREHDPRGPQALVPRAFRLAAWAATLALSFWAGRHYERRGGEALDGLAGRQSAATSPAPSPSGADVPQRFRPPSAIGLAVPTTPAPPPWASSGQEGHSDAARNEPLTPVQRQAPQPGEYSLHLAQLATRAEARAFASQMQRRGYPPHLFAAGGSSSRTLVRLGRFASPAEAEAVRARLARSDVQATVVRQRPGDVLVERTHGRGH